MSVKNHLSLPQIPRWWWIQWTVHKLRHHKSCGGGNLLWCQLQLRGLLCSSEWWRNCELRVDLSVQFSFFRPTLCKHHEWMSINLLHSDYVTWYRNFANKMLFLSSSFFVPAKNRRNTGTYELLIILLASFFSQRCRAFISSLVERFLDPAHAGSSPHALLSLEHKW